jgi:phosphoglycolate phosphatase-like HAD superfamily hydrolase
LPERHSEHRSSAVHNIPAIGVSWGYGQVTDMERSGAIGIAHDTTQLLQLIEA